jgi:hypothetical protein
MVSSNRPRTPSGGASPPPPDKLASIPEGSSKQNQTRRSSLGLLLRRTKSSDLGPKGSKKHQAREAELARQREAAAASRSPPSLPVLYNGAAPPALQTFGGDDQAMSGRNSNTYQGRGSMEPGRASVAGSVPVPQVPGIGSRKGDWVDPYARTESMTHRGRYSYASSAVSTINSPRRVRRRKDPTPFK